MYYNTRQVAEMLGVREKTIRTWVDKGILGASRIGGKALVISDADLKQAYDKNLVKKVK